MSLLRRPKRSRHRNSGLQAVLRGARHCVKPPRADARGCVAPIRQRDGYERPGTRWGKKNPKKSAAVLLGLLSRAPGPRQKTRRILQTHHGGRDRPEGAVASSPVLSPYQEQAADGNNRSGGLGGVPHREPAKTTSGAAGWSIRLLLARGSGRRRSGDLREATAALSLASEPRRRPLPETLPTRGRDSRFRHGDVCESKNERAGKHSPEPDRGRRTISLSRLPFRPAR
jgi:hypothetical protein